MSYEKFIHEFLGKGLLKKQKTNFRAIQKLMTRAHRDLKTAKANLSIDEGIAYTIAYLAMLRAGRAVMLLRGFRPANGYQHKTVVEFMGYVLGKEFKAMVERFDKMRKKRNVFTYDVSISISKVEANNALNTAVRFVYLTDDIIKKQNPQTEFKS